MATPKLKSSFAGYWRIVSMSAWDDDYLDADGQAFIDFNDKGGGSGGGSFCFGYVHGEMDCRLTARDGKPAVEWTWDGNDEMDPAQGRGWAVVNGDELHGMTFIHLGDDFAFMAKTANATKGKRIHKISTTIHPNTEGHHGKSGTTEKSHPGRD